MDVNLTDDTKAMRVSTDAATLTDGADISQVRVRGAGGMGGYEDLLPGCYEAKENVETFSSKFNISRQYSLPFQVARVENGDNLEFLPQIFEQKEEVRSKPSVRLIRTEYKIDSDSPTQIDIVWAIDNGGSIRTVTSEIEIMTDTKWTALTEKTAPVIRIYKTDHSVTLCKVKWDLKKGDTVWHLRVRPRAKDEVWDWSDAIRIEIESPKLGSIRFKASDRGGSLLY